MFTILRRDVIDMSMMPPYAICPLYDAARHAMMSGAITDAATPPRYC